MESMELHTKKVMSTQKPTLEIPSMKDDKKTAESDSIFVTFQSKDPIIQPSGKDVEARGGGRSGGDGHGMSSHSTSYIETLMHHFKGNVGSGMFALGDAFKHAGLLLAPPLTIFLGVICIHAQHILLNCNEEVRRRFSGTLKHDDAGYAEKALCAPGLCDFGQLVNLFLCITQLGFCCVYFVFISTNMKQVLDTWGVELSLQLHMALALLPILFSTWIRNLKFLVPLSSLANILIISGYIATIYIMSHDLPPISERKYVAEWNALPLFFGTVIYSFEGITLVLPLKNEMKKPKKFDMPLGVLNVGMVIVGGMFVLLGFLSYLKYGEEILGSVTLNLKTTETLPQCIKLSISLSILLTYALQFYVPIAIMWPGVEQRLGPFSCPVIAETLFRTVLCILTFVLAELIPHLALFISLVGAVSSTALALIFPPIIELVVTWQNASLDKITVTKDIFILLVGLLGFVTGTYESITRIIEAFSKA